jgi:exopolysaccharide biosynthesis polyprenyl glycosylphosphotransferase
VRVRRYGRPMEVPGAIRGHRSGDEAATPPGAARAPFEKWRTGLRREGRPPSLEDLQADREAVAERLTRPEPERRTRQRRPDDVPYLRSIPVKRDEATVAQRSRKRDAIFRRSLALADVIGALIALLLTQLVAGIGEQPLQLYLCVLAVVLVSKVIGLYDRDELLIGKATLNEIPALFQLSTVYALVVTTLAATTSNPFSAGTIVLLWGLLFVSSIIARATARQICRKTTAPERCLVLGDIEQAHDVRAKFRNHESIHGEVIAFLPFQSFELGRKRDDDFARYVIERNINRVIVTQDDSSERVLETVRYFKEYGVKVSVLPNILQVVGSSVEFDEIHGTTMLGVRSFGLSRSSQLLKRAFDLVSGLLVTVVFAPLLAAIALAIKLDSRGPVLFAQTRVGQDGLRFRMYKFRTMFDGADRLRAELADRNQTDGLFKIKDDPRVTRVGKFLRRTSLDELPQLINVVRGEMSLVGPRPLVEDEDSQVEGWHRRRLHLMPGMTGAWQIMGNTRVPLREMVMMDYLYIVNWSLWADVKILIRTAGHVLGRRGL